MERKLKLSLLALLASLLMVGCAGAATREDSAKAQADSRAEPKIASQNTKPLIVADFSGCTDENNLGGQMGAAYNAPDSLTESYVDEAGRGCVAKLSYNIKGWSAFWMKLQGVDLSPYRSLAFDIRADPSPGIPTQMKLELKRANGAEVSIEYVSGIESTWKTMSINLADFKSPGYAKPLTTLSEMEELVFTFEAAKSGGQGVVYLDNISFR